MIEHQGSEMIPQHALMKASLNSTHPILYGLIFGFDSWLRQWLRVSEYSDHPLCIFRIQVSQLDHTIVLADGASAQPGDRIIDLHLWNEHVPRMSSDGVSVGWALEMSRCVDVSLRELAAYLSFEWELEDIVIIRGNVVFCTADKCDELIRLCSRLGFECPCGGLPIGLAEQLLRFGQNLLISMMVLVLNSAALRADTLRRTRVGLYLTRKQLMARYLVPLSVRADLEAEKCSGQ
jgi:hypothetical protein